MTVSDSESRSALVRFQDLTAARIDWAEHERAARENATGDTPKLASKRSLIAVSHAIERAVPAGPVQPPRS
jgi:hypothetical protein